MTVLVNCDGLHDGPTNMARDAALLSSLETHSVAARVYGWDQPWVTLGMFQHPEEALLPGCPIPWVMRPTGGRAVLHGHDVTLGLAVSMPALSEMSGLVPERMRRSVKAAYRLAVGPIVEALCACGVPAVLGEARPQDRPAHSADCFASVSGNDVIHARTGDKVCGVAMRLTDVGVLVQASIPVRAPRVDPATVYADPAPVHFSNLDMDAFAGNLDERLVQMEGNR